MEYPFKSLKSGPRNKRDLFSILGLPSEKLPDFWHLPFCPCNGPLAFLHSGLQPTQGTLLDMFRTLAPRDNVFARTPFVGAHLTPKKSSTCCALSQHHGTCLHLARGREFILFCGNPRYSDPGRIACCNPRRDLPWLVTVPTHGHNMAWS